MKHKVLLVDGMPIAYANHAKLGHLKTRAGETTGMIFGFMRSIRAHARDLQATQVAIAWDLPGQVLKATGIAGYKANRTWTSEKQAMFDQLPLLKKMISATWWAQASAPGYEADDVLAALARNLQGDEFPIEHIYILSPDNDLLQLVSNRVTVVTSNKATAAKNQFTHWTPERVRAEWGVMPRGMALYRSIIGDKSDNVAGVGWSKERIEALKTKLNTLSVDGPTLGLLDLGIAPSQSLVENYNVTCLHDPEQIDIEKGGRDVESLRAFFTRIEAQSLVKVAESYAQP